MLFKLTYTSGKNKAAVWVLAYEDSYLFYVARDLGFIWGVKVCWNYSTTNEVPQLRGTPSSN